MFLVNILTYCAQNEEEIIKVSLIFFLLIWIGSTSQYKGIPYNLRKWLKWWKMHLKVFFRIFRQILKLNVVASFKVRKDDQYSLTPNFNKCHTGLSTNQTLVRNIQYNISEANGAIIWFGNSIRVSKEWK